MSYEFVKRPRQNKRFEKAFSYSPSLVVHAVRCSPRDSPRLLPPGGTSGRHSKFTNPPRFRVKVVHFVNFVNVGKGGAKVRIFVPWAVRTLGPFKSFARAFGLASPRGRAQRKGHDEPAQGRSPGRSPVPRALVAARLRRLGDPRRGPRDDLRGGALGAFGVQLAALAFPLREARRRELGALPVAADPVQPGLGAQRLGAGLHRLRQPCR